MEEITQIWRDTVGDLNTSIDRKTFGKINLALDDAIETKELAQEETGAAGDPRNSTPPAASSHPAPTSSSIDSSLDTETIDVTNLDVWGPEFDPMTAFDSTNIEEITAYFVKAAGGLDKMMNFDMFCEWEDVKELLDEQVMTPKILEATWKEATKGKAYISYDTFLRLNVKLDLVMDDLEAAEGGGGYSDKKEVEIDEAESFYRSEFKNSLAEGL